MKKINHRYYKTERTNKPREVRKTPCKHKQMKTKIFLVVHIARN